MKVEKTSRMTESSTMVTEMTSKIKDTEEKAVTYINEGIESSIVVQKNYEHKKNE